MTKTINFPNLRHLRYRAFGRTRFAARLKNFLAAESTRLTSSATGQTVSVQHISNVDALNTGTVATNPSNGETLTLGANTYTFKSALTGVKATGVLTSSANYADAETVTIGSKVYTFQNTLTNVDGHVKIGASEAASIANLHHAINASGGTVGTDYATLTTANTQVTAVDNGAHTVTVTAILFGTAANAIATTETSATASWGAVTLTGGINSVVGEIKIGVAATNTRDNIVTGVNASGGTSGTDYSAANVADTAVTLATSSTVDFTITAKAHGTAGNGIALSASTAHITFNPTLTAATAVLTSSANYADGETFTLGGKLYTLQSTLTEAQGHIKIGASEAATMTNIARAVTGSGGTPGTDYALANSADPNFTATSDGSHAVTFTARASGTAGNGFATKETSATASFGGTVSSGGLDTATAGGVTEDWFKLTATSHTFQENEGPYVMTAGTTLPAGYTAGRRVWIHVVSGSVVALKTQRGGTKFVHFTDTGTGTLTLTKAHDSAAFFEILRDANTRTILAASDIDNLA